VGGSTRQGETSSAKALLVIFPIFLGVLTVGTLAMLIAAAGPSTLELAQRAGVMLTSWVAVVSLAILLARTWWFDRPLGVPTRFFWTFTAFIAVNLAAVFTAANKGYALSGFTYWASLFALFFVVASVFRTPGDTWTPLVVVGGTSAVIAVVALALYLGSRLFGLALPADRLFNSPEVMAHLVLLGFVIVAGATARRKGLWWTVPVLAAYGVVLSARTFLAVAGAAVIVWMIIVGLRRTRLTAVKASALAFLLAAVAAVAAVAAASGVAFWRTGTPYLMDRGLVARYHAMSGACSMIAERPILGRGAGGYLIAAPQHWTSAEQDAYRQTRYLSEWAPSESLQLAIEAGLGATALYVALVILAMYAGLQFAFTEGDRDLRRFGATCAVLAAALGTEGLLSANLHMPVPAVTFFLMLGGLSGVTTRVEEAAAPSVSAKKATPGGAWRVVVVVLTLVLPLLSTRAFLAEVRLRDGQAAVKAGRLQDATAAFVKATALTPHDWRVHHALGLAILLARQPAEAMPHFEKALAMNPNAVDSVVGLARAEFNLASQTADAIDELLSKATEHARLAAHLLPGSPEVYDLLARVSVLRAQRLQDAGADAEATSAAWHEAEDNLLKAVDAHAEQSQKLLQILAHVRTALGDLEGVEQAYVRALHAAPDERETWTLFRQFTRTTGRHAALLDMMNWRIHAVEADPAGTPGAIADAHLDKAQFLREISSDPILVAEAYRGAALADPNRQETWAAFYAFARAAKLDDLFNATLIDAHKALTAADVPVPKVLNAAAKAATGSAAALLDATRLILEDVDGLAPSHMVGRRTIWSWVLDLCLTEASGPLLAPYERSAVLLNLGRVLMALEEFEGAQALLAQVQPHLLGREQTVCLELRIDALLRLDRLGEAIPLLRDAVARVPNDTGVHLTLARALAQQGQTDAARFEYQVLLGLPGLPPGDHARIRLEMEALP